MNLFFKITSGFAFAVFCVVSILLPGIIQFALNRNLSGFYRFLTFVIGMLLISWTGLIFLKQFNGTAGILILCSWWLLNGAFSVAAACFDSNKVRFVTFRSVIKAVTATLISGVIVILFAIYKPMILGWQLYQIPSLSMFPTLKLGDIVLAKTFSLRNKVIRAGDIVIFVRSGSPQFYIKRIVAKGGDTVEIVDQTLKVNRVDVKFHEELKNVTLRTVEPKHVFVIGDNAGKSYDSRAFGTIKEENLEAIFHHVVYRYSR